MRRRITTLIAALALCPILASADDRPIKFDKLPEPARTFISVNFPDAKVSLTTMDDDVVRPDYEVVLADGTEIQFEHNGDLEKIEARKGVPKGLIPVRISEYLKLHYPDAFVIEYEVGKKTYEVKLSNRLELKFNSKFKLIEIDD